MKLPSYGSTTTVGTLLGLMLVGGSLLVDVAHGTTITECQLSNPVAIDKDETVYLQQVKNTNDGTYTMKLTYTDGQAWIGIGINTDGDNKMAPANAIIGRADDGGDASKRVLYYSMSSDDEDASGVQPYSDSTLKDATFLQDDTVSVLTFTQDLDEMQVTDDSMWIFAVGLPDNEWVGKHKIHGSFQIALTESCTSITVATESPTDAPTTGSPTWVPTEAPITSEPTATPTTTTYVLNSLGDTTTPPAAAAATTTETTENPTFAPSSKTQQSSPSQEPTSLQPTKAPTAAPTNGVSGLLDPNFFATVTSHSDSSDGIAITLHDTAHPDKTLWLAHGIILTIAWAVCAPLAIGASILRNTLRTRLVGATASWYDVHVYLNVLTMVLTLVGFLLGVVATQQEGKLHFQEDVHHKAGLAIMLLVFVQAAAGQFRPGMPKPPPTAVVAFSTTFRDDGDEESSVTGTFPPSSSSRATTTTPTHPAKVVVLTTALENVDEESTPREQHAGNVATTGTSPPTTPSRSTTSPPASPGKAPRVMKAVPAAKSTLRLAWEWSHRLGGVVLVGLAWYNCHTGIEWQVENWEDTKDWTGIFWGITAGISGTMFVLAYVVRLN